MPRKKGSEDAPGRFHDHSCTAPSPLRNSFNGSGASKVSKAVECDGKLIFNSHLWGVRVAAENEVILDAVKEFVVRLGVDAQISSKTFRISFFVEKQYKPQLTVFGHIMRKENALAKEEMKKATDSRFHDDVLRKLLALDVSTLSCRLDRWR
jgi:hypothetical protein